MLCQSLLYSKVTHLYTYRHSFFNSLFYYGLSQDIAYSSLCYTVGPCCLSVLYSLPLLIPNSQSFSPPPPLPLGNHKSLNTISLSPVILTATPGGNYYRPSPFYCHMELVSHLLGIDSRIYKKNILRGHQSKITHTHILKGFLCSSNEV